jgi:ATP synthase protein I
MSDAETPDAEPDPHDRLAALDRAVKDALERREIEHRKAALREAQAVSAQRGGLAWRMVTNLVLSTVLFSAAGFGLDQWVGSAPFGLLAGLFVGFAVGMWMAARAALGVKVSPAGEEQPKGGGSGSERA